jgi:hypothetical protein
MSAARTRIRKGSVFVLQKIRDVSPTLPIIEARNTGASPPTAYTYPIPQRVAVMIRIRKGRKKQQRIIQHRTKDMFDPLTTQRWESPIIRY